MFERHNEIWSSSFIFFRWGPSWTYTDAWSIKDKQADSFAWKSNLKLRMSVFRPISEKHRSAHGVPQLQSVEVYVVIWWQSSVSTSHVSRQQSLSCESEKRVDALISRLEPFICYIFNWLSACQFLYRNKTKQDFFQRQKPTYNIVFFPLKEILNMNITIHSTKKHYKRYVFVPVTFLITYFFKRFTVSDIFVTPILALIFLHQALKILKSLLKFKL